MSRDIQAVVDAILPKPTMTILVIAIPTEHAYGIEREDLVTLNIKEPS